MRLNSAFLAFIALKVVVSTSSSSGTDKSTPSSTTTTKVANEDVGGLLLLIDDAASGAGGADTDDVATDESRGVDERDRDGDVSVSGGAIESPEPRNLVDMIIPADDADEKAAVGVGVTRHLTVVGRHTGTAVGLRGTKESYASTNADVNAGLVADLHGGAASATDISKSLRSTTAIASGANESSRSDSNEIKAVAPSSATRHLTVAQMSVLVQLGQTIDGEAADDLSGLSVAISSDGKTVAIGAPYNDGYRGHVRVYTYGEIDGNLAWVQIGQTIDGEAADDWSGASVAMSSDGKTVAIGAPYNDGYRGHVRVYTYGEIDGNLAWVQIGQDIVGEAADDWSGSSVAMSSDGKTVAIGTPNNDGYRGHVRVYTYGEIDGNLAWVQIGQDIDGEAADDLSGSSVAMSSDGKTVAIGAPYNDGSRGHVRVYTYGEIDGNLAWVQIGQDIDGEYAGDLSGSSVAMSSDGKTVAIGAPYNDGSRGHVRVYTYGEIDGNLAWVQIGQDIDGEAADDWSGASVAMSSDGKTVAIGTPNNDGYRVYTYGEIDGNLAWVQVGQDIDGEAVGDQSGWSVAMSSDGKTVAMLFEGKSVAIEAPLNVGHVRVFQVVCDDKCVLKALYDATAGDDWTDKTNWNFDDADSDPCSSSLAWRGVTCTDGKVSGITLHENNLVGSIPTEIGLLTTLAELVLHSNEISGPIPTEIETLTSLVALDLEVNQLTGTIPKEIGALTSLTELSLSFNQLTGTLPPQLGDLKALRYLSISDTGDAGIEGTIPIEFGELSELGSLRLQNNALAGPIPKVLWSLTSLVELDLYGNQLTGTIPKEIGALTSLEELYLSFNQLTGTLPPQLGDLNALRYLWISDTGDAGIEGTIPIEFGELSELGSLRLQNNALAGPIPTVLESLTSLVELDLYGNQLTGTIPEVLGKLTSLEELYLSFNQLTGTLPPQLGDLNALTDLWISDTGDAGIEGTIPIEFGELSELGSLRLQNNALAGPIPTVLESLTSLVELDLYGNQLTGTIPEVLGKLTSLEELYLSFNQLTGTLPPQLGDLNALRYLWISDTGDAGIKGTIPIEFGELSELGSLQLQNNALTGTIPGALAERIVEESDVCGNQLDSYPEECPVDTDNDGVPDYMDQCPNEGGFIHADGCPVDSDNDGVRDCVSTSEEAQCHSTTESTTISDLDSCCNIERDYCPDDTPRGATVYTESKTINDETIQPGCKSDTDGDGVYDGLDRCPDTTADDLERIAASKTMDLDERGCVVLSPGMWEATFLEEATVVSNLNGMTNLDLLFTVNKDLYDFAKARADLPLVDNQVMDASCINAFDDLTDTDALIEGISSSVAENPQAISYTDEISADAVPVMVGLGFDISKLIGSTLWTEEPNGIARIDFCLKLSVLSYADALDATKSEVVTYENIKTSILLDMEQEFSVIGTKIKLDEAGAAEATIDVEYPLYACRCGDDDACVDSESLSQSEALKVCIRFAPDADNDNDLPPDFVKMTDVKSFTCSQNSVSMQPIDDFEPQGVAGQLTSVKTINNELDTGGSYTQDDRMLIVTTQLLGNFFGPQELPVDCSGTVVYEFEAGSGVLADESASQRLLSQTSVALTPEQSLRRVAKDGTAEAEAESESEFSINIVLAKAKTENGRGIGGNRGAIAGIAIAGVVIAGVAVASVSAVVGVGATAAGGAAAAGSFGSAISSVVAKLFGTPTAAPPAPAAPVQSQPLAEMNEVGGQEVTNDFCVVTGAVA